jgi:MFS family permease
LAQGFALSGEYSGAIVYVAENAPADKKGYYTGFIQATVPIGLLLCLVVVIAVQAVMSPEAFASWGWRIPFLSSAFLVLFSYFARRKMDETPVYLEMKASGNLSKSPVRESLNSWKKIKVMLMLIFGGNAAQSAIMQTSQFVTLYFLQRAMKVDEFTSFTILAVAMLLGTPFFQWAGAWSDKIGRKKVIFMGICLAMISIPVSFYLFHAMGNPEGLATAHGLPLHTTLLFIVLSFVNMIASALVYGPMGIFIMEYFESKVRYTSMGFTHNVGNGLIGGATPLVTEFLKANIMVGAALSPFIGLIYPIGLVVLAFIINPFLKESKDLQD